ncbi:unnamed protein product, partial [Phaeothamnion confervicola]
MQPVPPLLRPVAVVPRSRHVRFCRRAPRLCHCCCLCHCRCRHCGRVPSDGRCCEPSRGLGDHKRRHRRRCRRHLRRLRLLAAVAVGAVLRPPCSRLYCCYCRRRRAPR